MRHVVLALVLLLPGCYESFTVSGVGDAGGAEGGVSALDSTIPPAPEPDTGVPVPAGPCDGGEIVPAYSGPGCAAETLACLEGCSTDPTSPPECSESCLAGDPECIACFNQTIISCTNRMSCQAEWNAFACCAEMRCPEVGDGADRLACAMTGECLMELDVYTTCADGGGFAACNMEIQRCFGVTT